MLEQLNAIRLQFAVRSKRHIVPLLIVMILFITGIVLLWQRIVIVVPGGSVGVLYRPFSGGIQLDRTLGEGLHIIWPLNFVTQYSTRVNAQELDLTLLTSDLLEVDVKVVFQYEINRQTATLLHRYVGPDYLKKIMIPQVVAALRDQVAKHSSKNAFTLDLREVMTNIALTADDLIIDDLSPRGLKHVRLVKVRAVEIISVTYPQSVRAAIQNKMVEAQHAEAFAYIVDISRQEAQRKVIEAKGIKNFLDIAFNGVNADYLLYRGLEASESLAKSANSKVLLFGSGASGLPLMLNDQAVRQALPVK
jgi:regulator of protease activity HflC (stomatin/prohibitin superfamily)